MPEAQVRVGVCGGIAQLAAVGKVDLRAAGDGEQLKHVVERHARAGQDLDGALREADHLRDDLRAEHRAFCLTAGQHARDAAADERFERAPVEFIFGVESLEMLEAVKRFTPKDHILAFMPARTMYPDFIAGGAGIIRLWEDWLHEITPDMVHKAGADQVWIMCNTPERGMDGTPESLDRFLTIHVDGALVSDVAMAAQWMKQHGIL